MTAHKKFKDGDHLTEEEHQAQFTEMLSYIASNYPLEISAFSVVAPFYGEAPTRNAFSKFCKEVVFSKDLSFDYWTDELDSKVDEFVTSLVSAAIRTRKKIGSQDLQKLKGVNLEHKSFNPQGAKRKILEPIDLGSTNYYGLSSDEMAQLAEAYSKGKVSFCKTFLAFRNTTLHSAATVYDNYEAFTKKNFSYVLQIPGID